MGDLMKRAVLVVGGLLAAGCGGGGGSGGAFDIATQMAADVFYYAPLDHPPTDYSQLALTYDASTAKMLATLPFGSLALRGFSGPVTGATTFDVTEAEYGESVAVDGSGEITQGGAAVTVSFSLTATPTDPPWSFTGTLDHVAPPGA